MKYFYVIGPGTTRYMIAADSVVEIDEFYHLHETALKKSIQEKRPMSRRSWVSRTWTTWHSDRLPILVAGKSFSKVRPHECL